MPSTAGSCPAVFVFPLGLLSSIPFLCLLSPALVNQPPSHTAFPAHPSPTTVTASIRPKAGSEESEICVLVCKMPREPSLHGRAQHEGLHNGVGRETSPGRAARKFPTSFSYSNPSRALRLVGSHGAGIWARDVSLQVQIFALQDRQRHGSLCSSWRIGSRSFLLLDGWTASLARPICRMELQVFIPFHFNHVLLLLTCFSLSVDQSPLARQRLSRGGVCNLWPPG